MGDTFDLNRLGVSTKNFTNWKSEYLKLIKAIKKLPLDQTSYPKLFPLLKRIIIVASNLSNLAFLKENDNKNKIYLAADKFLAKHPLLIADLEKSIVESMPQEELNNLCVKLKTKDLTHYFNNVRETLRDYISDKQMAKLTPLIIKQTNIIQAYEVNANKYKDQIVETIVANLNKTDDEIFKLLKLEVQRINSSFLKVESKQFERFSRARFLAIKIQKALGYKDDIEEATKAYGLENQVRTISMVWTEFEELNKTFNTLERKLVDKVYSPQHDIAYNLIFKLRFSPLKTVDEMKSLLSNAYKNFSPELALFLEQQIMIEGKYDTQNRNSKARGLAFTLTNEQGENFVSSHYDQSIDWQRTLAHEWGHALHGELTHETFINAEHQPAMVEGPSTIAELIYSFELLKEANDSRVKIAIVSLILRELFNRFSYAPKMIAFTNEIGLCFNAKWTKEEYVESALKIKTKLNWYIEEESILKLEKSLFIAHLPSDIFLFQYILADALAWINYNNLLQNNFDLEKFYKTPLCFTDLVKHYAANGLDINSQTGFNQLKPIIENLLKEYEKLINNL